MTQTLSLKARLFECVPAGRYAIAGLLQLLDVVETDAIPTAAVECRAQPRLLINPAFVERHAETPEKLMMLVLHEIHHVLLGHTRRLGGPTAADNFVFDCVINALLCRMFPQPAYTAMFRDFYREHRFPECLLRPPEGWDPRTNTIPVPRGLRKEARSAARQVYRNLYSKEGASYADIHCLLPLLQQDVALEEVPLLGDHAGSAQGQATASDGAFAEAVSRVVQRWPSPPDPLQGTSLNELLQERNIRAARMPSARAQLRTLFSKIAHHGATRSGARCWTANDINIESPVPAPDRRAWIARVLGATPLLYRTLLTTEQRLPSQRRVHLYVDVSGSMASIKSALYGAVQDCLPLLHPSIYLFSTRVAEISHAQLRRGDCVTTLGTDIRCVTAHMARHRVTRAVLLTDGYVGDPDPAGKAVLSAAKVGVAYFGDHINESSLAPYARASVRLQIPRGNTK